MEINEELCIGCGVCVDVAPELLEMNDEQIAVLTVDSIKDGQAETVQAAIECCPVDAIIAS